MFFSGGSLLPGHTVPKSYMQTKIPLQNPRPGCAPTGSNQCWHNLLLGLDQSFNQPANSEYNSYSFSLNSFSLLCPLFSLFFVFLRLALIKQLLVTQFPISTHFSFHSSLSSFSYPYM